MADENARNRRDANYVSSVTLGSSTAAVYSSDFDLGTDAFKGENTEVAISIPAIAVSALGNAATLTVKVLGGASASPTTQISTAFVLTGATAVDPSVPIVYRFRVPSNALRYLRVSFVNSAGDQSAYAAEVSLRF